MRSKKEIEKMITYFCAAKQKLITETPPVFRFLLKNRLLRFELAVNLLNYFIGSYNPDWFDFDKCLFVDRDL